MRIISFISLVLLFSSYFTTSFAGKANETNELEISIDAHQTSLQDVLKDISKQTKWSISIDANLADKKISGSYSDVSIETFLRSVLKGQNLIVLYDEKRKLVEVRSFGKKSDLQLVVQSDEINLIPSEEELQEIAANQTQEQNTYNEYTNNPNSIEPITGMTLGEIDDLHKHEQIAYEEFISNPDSVEPVTGMKLVEIAALREQEQKAFEEYKNNPDSIEPLTGMSLGEIEALHSQESSIASDQNPEGGPENPIKNSDEGKNIGQ